MVLDYSCCIVLDSGPLAREKFDNKRVQKKRPTNPPVQSAENVRRNQTHNWEVSKEMAYFELKRSVRNVFCRLFAIISS